MTASAILAEIDAAPDESARTAVVAACTPDQLEQLLNELTYRQFCAEVDERIAAEHAALQAFEDQLAAAADDAARLRIIERAQADPSRGAEWLAEWQWRRSATDQAWADRYLAAIGALPS